jgi:hypothetical protein
MEGTSGVSEQESVLEVYFQQIWMLVIFSGTSGKNIKDSLIGIKLTKKT